MPIDEKKIQLTLIDKVTEKLKAIERSIGKLAHRFEELGTIGHMALGYIGFEGLGTFVEFSNEVVELDNRLELLNGRLSGLNMNFRTMVEMASESRTNLKDFGESYVRIGMSSSHLFKGRANDLNAFNMLLNKQTQLMHLTNSQLLSVNTSILDAMELGFFDWRHMKALLMHDNPLGRGFLQYLGISGEDVMKASRSHQLTSEKFVEYVLSDAQNINREFEKMTLTLNQMGSIIKNSMVLSFSDALMVFTKFANIVFKAFRFMGEKLPFLSRLMQNLFANTVLLTAAMTAMLAVATAMKKIATVTSIGLSGGTVGLILGGLTLLTTALSYFAESRKSKREEEAMSNELNQDEIAEDLDAIKDNTEAMANKMDDLKSSLNDMITRTENMIIHNQIQNSISLNGITDPNGFAEQFINELSKYYNKRGVI